jgi:endogenous inhibitor of DNA gyrase (YacG/DUF329 family)
MGQQKSQTAEERTEIQRTLNSEYPFCSARAKPAENAVEVAIPAKDMDSDDDELSEFEKLADRQGWDFEVIGTKKSQRGWNDRLRIW